jgi:transcriptional regulator with XRE-family HTH domain
MAGLSRATISRLERGHVETLTLEALRKICRALDIRIDVVARWRGGDLDRLANAAHAAMHESMAADFERLPGWIVRPEVSFSFYGERGVIDLLAWNANLRALLIIELKTQVVDISDLMATADRRKRLARKIASEQGWDPVVIGTWVAIARTRTNERRVAAYATVLRAAFPDDGRAVRRWLREPRGRLAALSFATFEHPQNAWRAHQQKAGVATGRRPPVCA